MKKYFCDKCNQEFEEKKDNYFKITTYYSENGIGYSDVFASCHINELGGWNGENKELCDVCFEELKSKFNKLLREFKYEI